MKKSNVFLLTSLLLIATVFSLTTILVYSEILHFYRGVTSFASNQGTLSFVVEGDRNFPQISVTNPQNATYSWHKTGIDYTISDDVALDTCWYSLNGGLTNTTIACGSSVSSITSVVGNNTWTIWTNDTSNNINYSSVSFVVTISGGVSVGSGGSTPLPLIIKDFRVEPERFNLFMVSNEEDSREIKIKNIGDRGLEINMSVSGIENTLSLSNTKITLLPGEEKSVSVRIIAPVKGVHTGKIVFTSGSLKKETFVVINVQSSESILDVMLTLPLWTKVIRTEKIIRALITLTQIGGTDKIDVTANYFIKDFEGSVFTIGSETFFISGTKNLVKEFDISDLPSGNYIVAVEIVYPNGFASSSDQFKIVREENIYLIIMVVLSILALIAIAYSIYKYKKSKKYAKS